MPAVLKPLKETVQKQLKAGQRAVLEQVLHTIGLQVAVQGCGTVCEQFTKTIAKYTKYSSEGELSKRDRLNSPLSALLVADYSLNLSVSRCNGLC